MDGCRRYTSELAAMMMAVMMMVVTEEYAYRRLTPSLLVASMPLHLAFTHHANSCNLRKRSQQKANALSKECKLLEENQ